MRALQEAARVLRPDGVVFTAAISRWAPRLDGVVADRLYRPLPQLLDLLPDIEDTGDLPPAHPAGFAAYTHRPDDLMAEVRDAGLEVEDLVGLEGLPLSVAETTARRDDPTDWQVMLDSARGIERVPELLGLSAHLLCTARRPAASPPGAGWSLRPRQAPATVGAIGSGLSFAVSRWT